MKEIEAWSPSDIDSADEGERFVVKVEKENPDSRVINVLDISPEDKDILKKEVEKWDGFIHAFIHPYYRYGAGGRDNYYVDESDNNPEDESERLWEFVKTILAEEPHHPIFLFEEKWKEYVGMISAIISQINHGNIYLVPTWPGSPTPFVENQPLPESQEDVDKNRGNAWEELKRFLQDIGVKSVYVDGCYLKKIDRPTELIIDDPAAKHLGGCVGAAIQNLSVGDKFDVKLGNHTFGLTREDLTGLGLDKFLPSNLRTDKAASE